MSYWATNHPLSAMINVLYMNSVMRKTDFCLCENKGADQPCSNCTAVLLLPLFSFDRLYNPSSSFIQNFKIIAFFCGCIDQFVLEPVRNLKTDFFHVTAHIVYGYIMCSNMRKSFLLKPVILICGYLLYNEKIAESLNFKIR